MDFKNMTIDDMFKAAKENPELFKEEAEKYQASVIEERCGDDEQCVWRNKGMLFKLNQEANKYTDPKARLNFVMNRFFRFIQENY